MINLDNPSDGHLPKLPEENFSFVVTRDGQTIRLLINDQLYILDKETAQKFSDALMKKTPF